MEVRMKGGAGRSISKYKKIVYSRHASVNGERRINQTIGRAVIDPWLSSWPFDGAAAPGSSGQGPGGIIPGPLRGCRVAPAGRRCASGGSS